MTNQEIVDLIKAGIAKELVIEKIKSCENSFDLTTKAMIQLKEQGVDDDIIALMLQEQKSRRNKVRARLELEIQHLASDRPEVRNAAFGYISRLGETAASALQETLGHTRPEMRIAAARTLGRLDHKESARLIRNLLADSEPEVRLAAADSLAQLQDDSALDLARKAMSTDLAPLDGYIRLLGRFREVKAVGFLKLRLYEDNDPLIRRQCAWALGELGLAEATTSLEDALLKDHSAIVRREAALALGKIHDPTSASKLTKACMNDPEAREAILTALANFPPATSVPFLIFAINQHLNEAETRAVLAGLRKLTHQNFGADIAKWNEWWEKNRDAIKKEGGPTPEEEGKKEEKTEDTIWQQTPTAKEDEYPLDAAAEDKKAETKPPAEEMLPQDKKEDGEPKEEKREEGQEDGDDATSSPQAAVSAAEIYRSVPPWLPREKGEQIYGDVVIPGMPSLPRRQASGESPPTRKRFLLAEAGMEPPTAKPSPEPHRTLPEENESEPVRHPYAVTADSFAHDAPAARSSDDMATEQRSHPAASAGDMKDAASTRPKAALPQQRRRAFTADAYDSE